MSVRSTPQNGQGGGGGGIGLNGGSIRDQVNQKKGRGSNDDDDNGDGGGKKKPDKYAHFPGSIVPVFRPPNDLNPGDHALRDLLTPRQSGAASRWSMSAQRSW